MEQLYDIIWANFGNPICGTDREKFSTLDDIFEEEFDFEPIKPLSSKTDRDDFNNMEETT